MTHDPQSPNPAGQPGQPNRPDQPAQNPYGQSAGGQPGQQPGSKFGTDAYDPNQYGGTAAEPKQFGLLKKVTIASAVLFVISFIAGLPAATDTAMLREQMEATGAPVDESMLQMAQNMAIGTTVATAVVGLALYALVIIGLYKRQNWARILGIVFAILSVLGGVWSLFNSGAVMAMGGVGVLSIVLGVITLIVNIYWLVLAFNPRVAEYLRKPRPAAF
ncbi:hypothetical protein GCM10022377_14530 [Zhihengliuella alba]|uniref:DUF2127 domain-containing protein n=1 Tax=Zhihengliuella alba TaxID=547018 RepID=A0ABP7DAY3_9MICC